MNRSKTAIKQRELPADPRIGIALGSGSARGWAHIGVLEALAEMGIRPGIVTGSSIGAFVGAAYANHQLSDLADWVRRLTWRGILSVMDLSLLEGGLLKGADLMQVAHAHMGTTDIEALPLTFGAVATELRTGREVWLRRGPVLEAVRASIALPGLFTPVEHEGRWLVDGGLVDPVPVSLCRALGAEVVIAVNLNGDIVGKRDRRRALAAGRRKERNGDAAGGGEEAAATLWERLAEQFANNLSAQRDVLMGRVLGRARTIPRMFEVMADAINIMQDRITKSRMAGDPPEVLLTPRLAWLGLMEFDRAADAIAEGRAAAERMRPILEEMMAGLGDPMEPASREPT